MVCNDRQLTQAQREAAYQQQRTGVVRAVRPFSGSATVENLIDYINRELGPAVRSAREAVNDVYLQVADNAPSANPLAFYFSTSTAAADPTTGRIRLNASPQNTATIMRVSQTNGRLVDVLPWLDVMAGGPTTPLGVVTLTDAINPGRFVRWDLNTMTDQGAYWDLGITVIESSDADPFVEDEAVVVGFISGVSAAGSTIPVGALSPIARDTFIGNITTATAAPVAVPLASIDSTSIIYDGTAHEMQRAALTGFAAATQNSNATTSAEPIVTFSASANMSNERVTTSSTSVTVSTSVASQIEFQRAALTGAIAAAANANTTLFSGIKDNGSAETDRTNLNFVSGDSNTAVVTDDAANDELEVAYNYVGSTTNVNLTSLTGDQNVVDISTLRCGGSVTVETVSANYSIDGFTAKTDGFWFWFIDRRTTGTPYGEFLEDISATTTSIRNDDELAARVHVGGRMLLYYSNGRWRATGSPPGRLIQVTEYAGGSGTHNFSRRTRTCFVEGCGGGGGGGGAEGSLGAYRFAAGGQAGEYQTLTLVDHTLSSGAYSIGAAGAGGVGTTGTTANATDGGDTTLNVVVNLAGGKGSATRTTGGTAAEINLAAHDQTAGPAGSEGLTFGAAGPGKTGTGGSTPFGAGGGPRSLAAATSGAQSGITANGPGAGGGGGYAANTTGDANGGDGFAGILRIWEFC